MGPRIESILIGSFDGKVVREQATPVRVLFVPRRHASELSDVAPVCGQGSIQVENGGGYCHVFGRCQLVDRCDEALEDAEGPEEVSNCSVAFEIRPSSLWSSLVCMIIPN